MRAALGIAPPAGVLLLHGGASAMSQSELAAVRGLLGKELAHTLAVWDILVIDGGTATGVAQLIGESRVSSMMEFPLVGVCPEAEVSWPGGPTGAEQNALDPNHTHFVLTPGSRWGAETPFMFALADALGKQNPSLALLINGGSIARQEVLANVAHGREIIVVRGSGRLADQIAAMWVGDLATPDEELAEIKRLGRITVFDINDGAHRFVELIRLKLGISHIG